MSGSRASPIKADAPMINFDAMKITNSSHCALHAVFKWTPSRHTRPSTYMAYRLGLGILI
jgi:hypothetical protein